MKVIFLNQDLGRTINILKLLTTGRPFKQKKNVLICFLCNTAILVGFETFVICKRKHAYEAMKAFESIREEWLSKENKMKKEGLIRNFINMGFKNFRIKKIKSAKLLFRSIL
ncbi:MAG: hypothetical protein CM1200mP16_11260 [Nitrospina sp.]|nr:MAG: hypothetical protein CM1200mP16_11260 [Nitrospina sp.]